MAVAKTDNASVDKIDTITVASKLPFDFVAETRDGTKVTFAGAKSVDAFGEKFLTDTFGLTSGVDADWFLRWADEVGDFAPLKSGAIFTADTREKARDASTERKKNVKTGMEQKTPEELGVEVVENKE